MALLPRRAANSLLALVAAFTALLGGTAHAQEKDPFAIAPDLDSRSVANLPKGPILAEIEVDGVVRPRLVNLVGEGDGLTIAAADARAAGLPVADDLKGPVTLRSLAVYKWTYDQFRQRLVVQLLRNNDGPNFHDLSRVERRGSNSTPLLAVRLDYDLSASHSGGSTALAGLFDAALVRGNVALASGFRAGIGDGRGLTTLRLDTTLQINLPAANTAIAVGDFVSATTIGQRAVRMGGIQLASNFELRPDLVTKPLPSFSGSVSVPTSIDIMTSDQRYRVGDLEPGTFKLQNVPLNEGRGAFSVVTRDSLGREVIQTTRFYTSRSLLAPGLSAYAVNAGFVRRRYGELSNDYGNFAASAFYRRGLSPFLTVEGSAESTTGLLNLGARGDFTLGNVALLSGEARVSRDSDAGKGTLLRISGESMGSRGGISVSYVRPSAHYRDVAARLGDPAPARQFVGDVSYNFGKNTVLHASFVDQVDAPNEKFRLPERHTQTFTGSFRTGLGKRVDLFASGGLRRADGENSAFASVGISVGLGAGRGAGAYVDYSSKKLSAGATYSKDSADITGLSYRVSAVGEAQQQRASATAAYRARSFELGGQINETNGAFDGRIDAHGSLLVAGGTAYARASTGNSYALVRSGNVGNVPVKLENKVIGKTNARGHLLVENLQPFQTQSLDVDSDHLPRDALVGQIKYVVSVPRRAVALMDLDVHAFRPVVRQIVDEKGQALGTGEMVVARPSGTQSMIGFDGSVEINALGGDRQLLVGPAEGGCVVELPNAKEIESGTTPLVCRVVSTVAALERVSSASAKARGLAGQKVARRD